jgi:hypothetical protein
MAHGSLGRTGQQFKELLLIRRLNSEYIDQRDKLAARRDRCHTQTRGSVITEVSLGMRASFVAF